MATIGRNAGAQMDGPGASKKNLVLLGDEETQSIYLHAAVGKTCLCNKLAGSAIPSDHQPTIGVDFKTIDIEGENENEKAQLQIWDTAGNKQFATMTQSYLGTADFIVLVYSVANKSSLDSLESTWLPIMRKHTPSEASLLLIGNQIDVGEERRQVERQNGEELAKQLGAQFFEWSTVDESFSNENNHPIIEWVRSGRPNVDQPSTVQDTSKANANPNSNNVDTSEEPSLSDNNMNITSSSSGESQKPATAKNKSLASATGSKPTVETKSQEDGEETKNDTDPPVASGSTTETKVGKSDTAGETSKSANDSKETAVTETESLAPFLSGESQATAGKTATHSTSTVEAGTKEDKEETKNDTESTDAQAEEADLTPIWLTKVGGTVLKKKLQDREFIFDTEDKSTPCIEYKNENGKVKGKIPVKYIEEVSAPDNRGFFSLRTGKYHNGGYRLKAKSSLEYERFKRAIDFMQEKL